MIGLRKCGVLVLATVLISMTANAWQGHNAPNFKWTPLKMRVAEKQEKWNYIKASGLSDGDCTRIEESEDGKKQVVETFATQYSSVGIADLNDDGVNDAMILVPWMGNGLNADGCSIAFLVSDGKGGRMLTTSEGHGQDLDDIAVISGKKYFMSSDFREGEGHNYWIFRPFEFFKDGSVREASEKVGKPFPALTIFYDQSKFKAEVITPKLRKMIDEGTKTTCEKFVPAAPRPSGFHYTSNDGNLLVSRPDWDNSKKMGDDWCNLVRLVRKVNGKYGAIEEVWCKETDRGSSGNYQMTSLDGKFLLEDCSFCNNGDPDAIFQSVTWKTDGKEIVVPLKNLK